MYRVTLIPGDGVGPEIADATRKCVEATGVKIDWDVQECGIEVINKVGQGSRSRSEVDQGQSGRPESTHHDPDRQGVPFSVNVYLRQELNLFACVRPCKLYKGVRTYFSGSNVDLVLVRENTEDLYAGVEFQSRRAVDVSTDRRHQQACHRQENWNRHQIRPVSASSRFLYEGTRQISGSRLTMRYNTAANR